MSRIIRSEASGISARAVEYHGFVYLQGIVPADPSQDIAGQTRDVLAQIDALLETHGTDKTRLLQAHIWLRDIADREALNAVWTAWLPAGGAPARTCVQAVLAAPDYLVEIMVTACR